ncbi:MAG: AIM24 family protein [Gracilibacteraceae bacterium]|jgi:uncharacterized protein (AIM24 family)|nr:AIM24 family protein [Gracilibacteraceae bacterium]
MHIENLISNNVKVIEQEGMFSVLEHITDLSQFTASEAISRYYMSNQGIRKRQLKIELTNQTVRLQAGAMQWMAGELELTSGVKGLGGLIGGAVRGAVTGEKAVVPQYKGTGIVITEPTYKHIFLIDVGQSPDGLVIADGLFYACDASLKMEVEFVKSVTGAVAGNQGWFNMRLVGGGVAAMESPIPFSELIRIDLAANDTLKVDGSFAIMWEGGITMTVERAGKSLIGSAMTGEGLTNVYRGNGSVYLATPAASAGVNYGSIVAGQKVQQNN